METHMVSGDVFQGELPVVNPRNKCIPIQFLGAHPLRLKRNLIIIQIFYSRENVCMANHCDLLMRQVAFI